MKEIYVGLTYIWQKVSPTRQGELCTGALKLQPEGLNQGPWLFPPFPYPHPQSIEGGFCFALALGKGQVCSWGSAQVPGHEPSAGL